MENQAFDNALRNAVNSSELPYEPSQWTALSDRLKAHEESSAPVVVPVAPPSGKSIPFYGRMAIAAAACLFILLMWNTVRKQQESTIAQPEVALSEQRLNTQPEKSPAGPAPAGSASAPAAPAFATASAIPRKTGIRQQVIAVLEPETRVTFPAATADSAGLRQEDLTSPPKHIAAEEEPRKGFARYPEDVEDFIPREAGRRTAYGVNGGYNLGNSKNNFTVGVTVKRELSERLNLEAGIAYVRANYETHVQMNSGLDTGVSITGQYTPADNRLAYLQAAPSVSYKIYRGLSAGGGVDAQRLLGNSTNTDVINAMGAKEASQPQWDFGVTARMDVQVTKKLRAGAMYRESIRAMSREPGQAAGRNYLLLQLSYTVF